MTATREPLPTAVQEPPPRAACPPGDRPPGGARRWLPIVLVAGAVVAVIFLGPGPSAVLATIQEHLTVWQEWAGRHPAESLLLFFATYALATALPLPVVTVASLLAGALFGRLLGTTVASLGYTAGVTLAFLWTRLLLRGWVRLHFGRWLRRVERGMARDGAFYLLTLRLLPSMPFFLVNLLMALTPIRTRTYVLVSWVGVLPISFLYAGVGRELAALESPSDILSASVLVSLALLAVAPLLVRLLLRLRARDGCPEPPDVP